MDICGKPTQFHVSVFADKVIPSASLSLRAPAQFGKAFLSDALWCFSKVLVIITQNGKPGTVMQT